MDYIIRGFRHIGLRGPWRPGGMGVKDAYQFPSPAFDALECPQLLDRVHAKASGALRYILDRKDLVHNPLRAGK